MPGSLYSIYTPPQAVVDFSAQTSSEGGWWEAVELTQIDLSENQLEALDGRLVEAFPQLVVLDVCFFSQSQLSSVLSVQ